MSTFTLNSDTLLAAAQRLPSSPRVFAALEAALRNPDIDIDSVVDIVRVDTNLAVRVIRVANSPVFRRGDATASLDMAISRIGLREIHRLVGAAVAEQLFAVGLPLYRISGDELWLNALVSAVAAEQLAYSAGLDSRDAYTLGLLRGAGRMLLQRVAQDMALPPTAGAKATGEETRQWEEETFGMMADEAGARLLKLWEFSDSTVDGLRYAWSPSTDPKRGLEPALLHLSCATTDRLEQGLAIETGQWSCEAGVLKQAGLDAEQASLAVPATRKAVNRALEMLKPGEKV